MPSALKVSWPSKSTAWPSTAPSVTMLPVRPLSRLASGSVALEASSAPFRVNLNVPVPTVEPLAPTVVFFTIGVAEPVPLPPPGLSGSMGVGSMSMSSVE